MQDKKEIKQWISSVCILTLVINLLVPLFLPMKEEVTTFISVMVSIVFYASLLFQCRIEEKIPVRVYTVFILCLIGIFTQLFMDGQIIRGITYCCLYLYLAMLRQVKTGKFETRYIILVLVCIASTGIGLFIESPSLNFCTTVLQICLLLIVLNPVFCKLAVRHRENDVHNTYQNVHMIRKILFGRNGKWELPNMKVLNGKEDNY